MVMGAAGGTQVLGDPQGYDRVEVTLERVDGHARRALQQPDDEASAMLITWPMRPVPTATTPTEARP